MASARRIDVAVGLKDRLSTLVAQLSAGVVGKEPPSFLWSQLLADNMKHLPDWEVKRSRLVAFWSFPLRRWRWRSCRLVPMLSSAIDQTFLRESTKRVVSTANRLNKLADERMSLLPDAPLGGAAF